MHFVCELSREVIVSKLGLKGGDAQRGIMSQYGNSGTLTDYLSGTADDPILHRLLLANPQCLMILLYEVFEWCYPP